MSDIPDLSTLLGMLNNKNISSNNDATPSLDDILNNTSSKNSDNSNTDSKMPDMEMIMKVMKLMNSLNSNTDNPSANLLYSLKPFLRDSKKEKIDQYVKFLKLSSVFNEINKSGGDLK